MPRRSIVILWLKEGGGGRLELMMVALDLMRTQWMDGLLQVYLTFWHLFKMTVDWLVSEHTVSPAKFLFTLAYRLTSFS